MLNKSYKYRAYPNKAQEELIQKTFGCVRFVYNHFLEDRITAYKERGENRTYFQQNKMLTALKREYPWLQEPDKNSLQYALRHLNDAYSYFFRDIKLGRSHGYPSYKRKKDNDKHYKTLNGNNGTVIRIDGNNIRLPKLGLVKSKISRFPPQNSRVVGATVSQSASGKYYISLLLEIEEPPINRIPQKSSAIGLDYSSPHFYVDSEGNVADMPHFYRDAERRLAREQRKLSKMVKDSNNWKKQKIRVARAYEKVRFCRADWQHKESTRLANQYDYICVEDINYQDMARGLKLAKATNDNAFGQFRQMLTYKVAERGKKLITIDKWYPSSKTCRFCGAVNSELTLKDREWTCPSCGAHIDRDLNAAINIRNEGLANVS